MLFSSITFIVCFLPLTLLVYYYCPAVRAKNAALLLASLVFYAWGEPAYVVIMLVSILANYRVGLFLGGTSSAVSARRWMLAAGVLINVLLLFYFKYFVFSERVFNKLLRIAQFPQVQLPILNIALPLGISFYTFQSISYLVDVYKNPALVQKNLLNLGLYISFFPQLIAGPIVRYHDINEQIRERPHSASSFAQGIERFIIGLSKKVLIANTMAAFADSVFAQPLELLPFYYLALGIVCYTFQIYYDFSGYSDMAIGLGKMFGFTLLENFNYPYAAKSITEFWRRWHISLSNWFRDYLYIPLGGNRKGNTRRNINLFIVFFITGLWHGAAVNFVAWGLGHGLLLFAEKILGRRIARCIKNERVKNVAGHIYTLISVALLWVFFRLGMRESLNFLWNLFSLNYGSRNMLLFISTMLDAQFAVCFAAAALAAFPWWKRLPLLNTRRLVPLRRCALIVLLLFAMCALASNAYNPFIYFRF
ncbi:MAG: MBOAT family protein [Spirochaetaceae bacterium]|jgi:alginate O-acetyltransferase complex protein AlgI|nr:MBOAT family protein [Spirochaetaceae bacterium]